MKEIPKEYQEIIAALVCNGFYIQPTGSRETKSGYTEYSDYDFVVLDESGRLKGDLRKRTETWKEGGSGNDHGEFVSFKSFLPISPAQLNLIITENKDYFNKWVVATDLIRKLDIKEKSQRIAVFDSIMNPEANKKVLPF